MWPPELIENRKKYVQKIEEIKALPNERPDEIFLHLGCGPQIIPGWVNIDKYYEHPKVTQCDIYSLPYPEGTVSAIYSSHSLEHLPIRHARKALMNWYKVLKPGGKLFLAVPDLEITIQALLDKNVPWLSRYTWFMHVLFGYQTDSSLTNPTLDAPIDYGQFHTCGFTKELLVSYLDADGYKIKEIYNYDGWDTPSIFLEADKE